MIHNNCRQLYQQCQFHVGGFIFHPLSLSDVRVWDVHLSTAGAFQPCCFRCSSALQFITEPWWVGEGQHEWCSCKAVLCAAQGGQETTRHCHFSTWWHQAIPVTEVSTDGFCVAKQISDALNADVGTNYKEISAPLHSACPSSGLRNWFSLSLGGLLTPMACTSGCQGHCNAKQGK